MNYFSTLSARQINKYSYNAICSWPIVQNFNPIFHNLDYSELIRFYLWDKVGRAVRMSFGGEDWKYEEQLYLKSKKIIDDYSSIITVDSVNQLSNDFSAEKDGKIHVFFPDNNPRLNNIISFLRVNAEFVLHLNPFDWVKFRTNPQKFELDKETLFFLKELHGHIVAGLSKQMISLFNFDIDVLFFEILRLELIIIQATQDLSQKKYNLVFLHTDNHPPYIVYTMIARQMGIPVVMFQHGLDCEHYFYDEAYASHVAVWGKERKMRYLNTSIQKPEICITGNPDYEGLFVQEQIKKKGEYILWATRPHTSEKCYSHYHSPMEGIRILKAIIQYIKQNNYIDKLIIKPHPASDINMYIQEIQKAGITKNILIDFTPLTEILTNAWVVILEDTSACIEAMIYGKPIIHVNFTSGENVLPLYEYKACLPAYNDIQLYNNLKRISEADEKRLTLIFSGYKNFLNDFVGPMDNKSLMRIKEFIQQSANS